MNSNELETLVRQAAAVAAPPRPIADEAMRRLESQRGQHGGRRTFWGHPLLLGAAAALSGIAAILAFVFLLAAPAAVTLGDVQHAVAQQRWMHVRYDGGQLKEQWVDLQTGEFFFTRDDGDIGYWSDPDNRRLTYWKYTDVIDEDTPTVYHKGEKSAPWTANSAWALVVAPLAQAAAATQPADPAMVSVVATKDFLAGRPMLRFDEYSADALGNRMLLRQLWADPQTHLPVRTRTRLQFGETQRTGRQWSMGGYDFPATGPADIYALGVPRGTPIHKEVSVAAADIRPVLDGIAHANDNFIKRYRVVVWTTRAFSNPPVESVDLIWRDGDKLYDERHLPGFELQNHPKPPIGALTADGLLAWAKQHEPVQKQMMNATYEYSWDSGDSYGKSKPRVLVRDRGPFPLLAQDSWPEDIQWPTRNGSPDFQRLPAGGDTPPGCIGLRSGGQGNVRLDLYIDPADDYLCMKQIQSDKHGDKWVKTRETTLSDLSRVEGRVVAGTMRVDTYDPHVPGYDDTEMTAIRLTPLKSDEFPAHIFDGAELMKGATVITH